MRFVRFVATLLLIAGALFLLGAIYLWMIGRGSLSDFLPALVAFFGGAILRALNEIHGEVEWMRKHLT